MQLFRLKIEGFTILCTFISIVNYTRVKKHVCKMFFKLRCPLAERDIFFWRSVQPVSKIF